MLTETASYSTPNTECNPYKFHIPAHTDGSWTQRHIAGWRSLPSHPKQLKSKNKNFPQVLHCTFYKSAIKSPLGIPTQRIIPRSTITMVTSSLPAPRSSISYTLKKIISAKLANQIKYPGRGVVTFMRSVKSGNVIFRIANFALIHVQLGNVHVHAEVSPQPENIVLKGGKKLEENENGEA